MQAPSVTASDALTPAMMKRVTTAGRHCVQSAVWDGAVHGVTALAKNEAFNATGQLACAWSTTARKHSTECVHRRSMMEKSPCGGVQGV